MTGQQLGCHSGLVVRSSSQNREVRGPNLDSILNTHFFFCMYLHVSARICTYLHVSARICFYSNVYCFLLQKLSKYEMYIYVRIVRMSLYLTYMYVYVRICMYTGIYVVHTYHICVYMHVYVRICMYMYVSLVTEIF